MTKITLEQVEQFMEMLTGGELPDGLMLANQPELTRNQAFSVIYYLQEILRVIPDKFEMCECGELFDGDCDGYIVGEYDSWYEEHWILPETVTANEGRIFCSIECEYDYLMKSQKGKAQS
jgi:hypothetical protein